MNASVAANGPNGTGNLHRIPAPPPRTPAIQCEHLVQFYENDEFLMDTVGAFLTEGIRSGEAGLVIATPAHRRSLERRLAEEGIDFASDRTYLALDAAETLSQFMVDGTPDRARFFQTLSPILRARLQRTQPVRAFGEMVALLWSEGNCAAAIRLEQLWNDLSHQFSFSLLCAYPMSGFRGTDNADPLRHICGAHSRVLPAESFSTALSAEEQFRSVALLQQKALSLEAEIDERKRAESVAHADQAKLEMAVSLAGIGIWEMDLKTGRSNCSEQCKAHFGIPARDSVEPARLFELIHVEDRPQVQQALDSAVANESDFTAEFRVIHPDGRLRWVSTMGRCVQNGHARFLGVTLDVTERTRTAELLEQAVAERTERLQETIGELEAFSYSISHDMRAPLRSMQGYARILVEECATKLDPEARNCLDRITASAERMDRLIQDVLTFSRVARTDLKLEPVNLDHLVRGIVECYPHMQPPLAEVVIERTLPQVFGNAAALTQCISNLLGNAVKFVSPGIEPKVQIWAELIDPPKRPHAIAVTQSCRIVRLCIRDNGIGIPAQAHESIFGIFQRLSKKYEGTGIGLAIVKKAVERMGGRLGLVSEPGKGSTFWLELRNSSGPGA